MPGRRSSLRWLAVSVLVLTGLSGCVTGTPYRAHPEAGQRLPRVKTLALLPPDVKIYELSAGGMTQLMDEWSARGRGHVVDAVRRRLTEQGQFALKEFTPDDSDARLRQTYEEVRALIEAVNDTALMHTYHPQLSIAEKRENFRYSIGPVPELADAVSADALVFVYGVDHISTAGRRALMVFGALVGGVTGVYVGPGAGITRLTISVVEPRTGDVLWFNVAVAAGHADLREPESVGHLTTTVLAGFPGGAKP